MSKTAVVRHHTCTQHTERVRRIHAIEGWILAYVCGELTDGQRRVAGPGAFQHHVLARREHLEYLRDNERCTKCGRPL